MVSLLLLYESKEKQLTYLMTAKFYSGISASDVEAYVFVLIPGFCLQLLWSCYLKFSLLYYGGLVQMFNPGNLEEGRKAHVFNNYCLMLHVIQRVKFHIVLIFGTLF